MAEFAVLYHDDPRGSHWDFLLQAGDVLKTWALPGPPESGTEMIARELPDHRLAYLDYEGPVSGDRGRVERLDRGTCKMLQRSERELVVELTGERLSGRVVLSRSEDDPSRWQFSYQAR